MNDERKIILINYVNHLCCSGKSYDYIGRYICHVKDFLDSDCALTKRGFKEYKLKNCEILHTPNACDAVLDLLSFVGVGYKRKSRRIGNVAPLEKLSSVSKKNQELINSFMYWLHENNDYSSSCMRCYHDTIKGFFEYSTEFSLEAAKRYIRTLEDKGRAPQTIRLRMMGLERFGKFVKKPIELKRPKYKRSLDTDNVPSESEYNKILSFLKGYGNMDYYFWIKILASTGARVSEFIQFTWEDILAGEATVRGKGNKYRRFFFPEKLQKEVRVYVKENGKKGIVATGRYGRITARGLSQNMKVWGEKAGVDRSKMHPHAFRHFFAKMYLKNSKDVIQLADILGHGSVDTTRIYLQKTKQEQMKDINKNVKW